MLKSHAANLSIQSGLRLLPSRHQLGPPCLGVSSLTSQLGFLTSQNSKGELSLQRKQVWSPWPQTTTPRPIHSEIAQPAGGQPSWAWDSSAGPGPRPRCSGQACQPSEQGCPHTSGVSLAPPKEELYYYSLPPSYGAGWHHREGALCFCTHKPGGRC